MTGPPLRALYAEDEVAWYDEMVALIDQGRYAELDLASLRQLLCDRGTSDRRHVGSRLRNLLFLILSGTRQPEGREADWAEAITGLQQRLRQDATSDTLRAHARRQMADLYVDAVELAAVATGLPEAEFPADCPFTLEQVLAFDPATA